MSALEQLPDGVMARDAARYFTWAWYSVWIVMTVIAFAFVDSWWWLLALAAGWAAVGGTCYARGYYTAKAQTGQ